MCDWIIKHKGIITKYYFQNKIPDNGNEFVIYVGEQNVYRTYEARVQSYNDKGTLTELISDIYKIKSAMGCEYHHFMSKSIIKSS